MYFCIIYALACALLLFPYLPVLFFGRVLGGISTSILFSAFESWVVAASSDSALQSEDLSIILGRATLINGFVATAAGVGPHSTLFKSIFRVCNGFGVTGILQSARRVLLRGLQITFHRERCIASACFCFDPYKLERELREQFWKAVGGRCIPDQTLRFCMVYRCN